MLPVLILAQQDGGRALLAGGAMMLVAFLLGIGLLIWALIDAIKNPGLTDNERIIWVIVILLVGCLGPILYLMTGRNKAGGPGRGREAI